MPKRLEFPQQLSADAGFEVIVAGPRVNVTITDDWAGDSITGFGESVDFNLERDQVEQLRDWLTAYLDETST